MVIGMKFADPDAYSGKSTLRVFLIAAFACCFILNSCDMSVDYHNPFDPQVKLQPPSNLRIDSVKETSVTLSWTNNYAVAGEYQTSRVGTVILFNYGRGNFPIDTVRGPASTVTITRVFSPGLSIGYATFCAYSIAGSNASDLSNYAATYAFNSSPSPSQIKATLLNKTTCRIGWQDNSSTELYFRIERKFNAGDTFTLLSQLPANTSSYVDSTISYTGDPIFYRICAVFAAGVSSPYDSTAVNVPLMAPTLNTVSTINTTSVRLAWSNNAPFGDGFIVERAEKNGSFIEVGRTAAAQFTDASPDTAKEYLYRVRMFAGTKTSDPSNSTDVGFWPIPVYVRGVTGSYNTIAVSPDYSLLALTGIGSGDISIVRSSDLQVVTQFHSANLVAQSVDINASNEYVAAGYADNAQSAGTIRIWRLSDGSLYKEWGRPTPVSAVRFSPDGSLLAADGYGNTFSIVDIRSDIVTYSLTGSRNLAFSRDQSSIAATGDFLYVWSLKDASLKLQFAYGYLGGNANMGAPAVGLKFFNDGLRLALSTTGLLTLWDVNAQTPVKGIVATIPINCFDITPDNAFVVISMVNRHWIVKTDPWILVSSTYISRSSHSMCCLSNGRLLLAGTEGLQEFYLQKQWTSPVTP